MGFGSSLNPCLPWPRSVHHCACHLGLHTRGVTAPHHSAAQCKSSVDIL
uniref:Uncharacterized protein n=1 Tax=Arundo donax TaxID=35708 RepID=A0A0A9FWQ9_ARUDO